MNLKLILLSFSINISNSLNFAYIDCMFELKILKRALYEHAKVEKAYFLFTRTSVILMLSCENLVHICLARL